MQKKQIITFPVSEVLGIIRYTPDMIRDLPVTVSGSKAVYTMGILCIGDKDVGLLKDKPLFKTLTKDLE
jgi:chemotaxis-related protein WspD